MDSGLQNTADLAIAQAQAGTGAVKPHGHLSMDAIDKKSKDFEGMFMSQMLQPMFEGLGVDKMFGGGHGEETMRSFLIQEYGKAMSSNSHLGIAASVKAAMIRSQEASNRPLASTANASQGAAAYATAQ